MFDPVSTMRVNEEILNNEGKISPKFIQNNRVIMRDLDTAVPQPVEDLRIEACYYDNFVQFFNKLRDMTTAYQYDRDLVINVDETTTSADTTKRTTKVLYDPNIDVRPMASVPSKQEHVTLCCGIAASGKSLIPTFIIKNKSVSVEDSLVGPQFDCGDYAIASSANGWQDAVRYLLFFDFYVLQRTFRQWLEIILLRHRQGLNKSDERILLIMDGHGTHTMESSVDFCRLNKIDVCFMPAHTSHILQPLDVGIFSSYKAAYRRAAKERGINDVECSWASEATRNRCRMLGRALIANMHAVTAYKVRRAFYDTGIYPVSIEHFIVNCFCVRDVPPEVRVQAKEVVAKEKEDRAQRLQNRPRRNVHDQLLLVDSSFEL